MMKISFLFIGLSIITFTACSVSGGGDDGGGPRTIAFAGRADGNYQIYVMREDGSGVKQLTHDEDNFATNPAWSPDGTQIAFETSRKAPIDTPNLYVMNADGSNIHPLVTNPTTVGGYPFPGRNPAWSPDGTKLAFDYCPFCEAGSLDYNIFVADLQAGTIDTLTHSPGSDQFPTWSPDGQHIAFSSDRAYVNGDSARYRRDLYVININGTDLKRLTTIGEATRPAWSPDGDQIAYEWNIHGNREFIYRISSDQINKVDSGLEFSGGGVWNRDGTKLLVGGRKTDNTQPQLRILDISEEQDSVLQIIEYRKDDIGPHVDWYSK